MRALIATSRSQGARDDDYMYCVPGELVWLTDICDADLDPLRKGCGCGRAFGGLASHRATTTVEVAEVDMTPAELRLAYETSLRDQGWIPAGAAADVVEEILGEALQIVRAVERVPVGTVIRRDLYNLHAYVAPLG